MEDFESISEMATDVFNVINEDGILDDFDLGEFIHIAFHDYNLQDEEFKKNLLLGLFYETNVSNYIEGEIAFYRKKYEGIKPLDKIYYNDNGEKLNSEHATQNEFLNQIQQFIYDFYSVFFASIKARYYSENGDNKNSVINILDEKKDNEKLKLKWSGQKNQLYNVLRQLKDRGLILNSYNNLADFLIQNVTGFEETKKETITKEIQRNIPIPKSKRFTVDPDNQEK